MDEHKRTLASLTMEQRKAVIAEVCPYCRAGLTETYEGPSDCYRLGVIHHIPHTRDKFACLADVLRCALGNASNEMDREQKNQPAQAAALGEP